MEPLLFESNESSAPMPNGNIVKKAHRFENQKVKENADRDLSQYSQTQKIIFDIWMDVLKTNDFGLKDNFFDVGGNSILAITVFTKIKSVFNVDLNLRVFFDSPRIFCLGEAVDATLNKWAESRLTNIILPGRTYIKGEI